jgi:DNA polymerase I-like protein with 3'-5' exonuclease and polymerase domains
MLGALDYSAIEAVLLGHYCQGSQAEWFKAALCKGADYHKLAMELTGITSRDLIKRMNYGFIYGMGLNKLMSINRPLFKQLATEAGTDVHTFGRLMYENYHNHFPVIRDTMRAIEEETKIAGYTVSIGGRHHHKPKPVYENGRWNSGIYKMTNYKIQGSASEILKNGLRNAAKAGVFDILQLNLTIHDENVVNIPYNKIGTEAVIELQHQMECSYKEQLSVPLKVAVDVGPTWGSYDLPIYGNMKQGVFDA